jgi:hypothetical protein
MPESDWHALVIIQPYRCALMALALYPKLKDAQAIKEIRQTSEMKIHVSSLFEDLAKVLILLPLRSIQSQ